MELTVKIKMPLMPDVLNFEAAPKPKQAGFQTAGNSIAVKDLTEEQANEFADEWKKAFLEHWKEKQN